MEKKVVFDVTIERAGLMQALDETLPPVLIPWFKRIVLGFAIFMLFFGIWDVVWAGEPFRNVALGWAVLGGLFFITYKAGDLSRAKDIKTYADHLLGLSTRLTGELSEADLILKWDGFEACPGWDWCKRVIQTKDALLFADEATICYILPLKALNADDADAILKMLKVRGLL